MDYDFEAPTYINFAEAMEDDEEEVSRYFDVEHEESFSRVKDTPGVILPEGPRDLPSAKRASYLKTALSKSSVETSCSQPRSSGKGRSPAKQRILQMKRASVKSGRVEKPSRSKVPVQTPGKVAPILKGLALTPVSAVPKCSGGKRARNELNPDSSLSLSKCSDKNYAGRVSVPATSLKVSPFAKSSESLVQEKNMKKSKLNNMEGMLSFIDGIQVAIPIQKQHIMETRADQAARHPPIQLRSRSISKVHADKKSVSSNMSRSYKRVSLPSDSSSQNASSQCGKLVKERFVSLAEATRQFHMRTPQRFRARPQNSPGPKKKGPLLALKATVPQSPALRVKNRNRPVTAVSREQREELELMEIHKYKIKPLPLPERILKPLNPIGKFEKKPPTLPEPFNITEVKKREPVFELDQVKFTARPVPKKILQGPVGIKEKKSINLTDPKSPAFLASALKRWKAVNKRSTPLKATQKYTMKVIEGSNGLQMVKDKPVGHLGVPFMPHIPKGNTEVKPFSFEERDKERMRRKEEKLKDLEEQMTQKPKFHANPVPSYRMRSVSPIIRSRTPSSQRKRTTSQQPIPDAQAVSLAQFKARPPTVLNKKPFEPVRPNRQLPLPNVTLASEIRAKDRELFDQQQMKRELELEALKQQLKVEKERKEKEEIALVRKQAVHKPNPLPKLKPFLPQPSDTNLTNPSTPFCLKRSLRKMEI